MKRHLLTFLLPLILMQQPAFAQTQPENEAVPIPDQPVLQAATGAPTPLVPLEGTEQVQLDLVNCGGWLDCALARLLLPASASIDQWNLHFDNTAAAPVAVQDSAIVAQGRLSGYQLSNAAPNSPIAVVKPAEPLPAQRIVSLPLRFDRAAIPPDQYRGRIYLTVGAPGNRLILPLDLSVRTGPLLPLLVLLIGIILGRLFKYMQDRGEPQANALKEVNRLNRTLDQLDPADRAIVERMVADARQLAVQEKLTEANTKIAAIQNRIGLLTKLRTLQNRLAVRDEPIKDDVVDAMLQEIDSARVRIAVEDDEAAKASLDTIISKLASSGTRSSGNSEIASDIVEMARGVRSDLDRPPAQVPAQAEPAARSRIQRILLFLSGMSELSDEVRAAATPWIIRPLLALLLLIGLSIVGINSLYIENGLTFGARPLSDYMGLILWGLSADVASRSLSSLQGSKES